MTMAWRKEEQREAAGERPALGALPQAQRTELERLREENRRLAVTLGGFSSFIASKGLLEEAWHYVNNLHALDEE